MDATDPKMLARVYKMTFASVYPLLVAKVEKKGRTRDEVNTVVKWLTGYDDAGLKAHIDRQTDYQTFFAEAPAYHPNAEKITGVICGYRVEDIADPVLRKVRHLDKLIDELAKGKVMEKVLRA